MHERPRARCVSTHTPMRMRVHKDGDSTALPVILLPLSACVGLAFPPLKTSSFFADAPLFLALYAVFLTAPSGSNSA